MSTSTRALSIIYSNKGSPQLVPDHFAFKLNQRTETKIYWKCTGMNCPAQIDTDINNNLLNTNREHNHLPESEDYMVKKF